MQMNKEKEDICYGGLKGYGKTYCEMIRLQQENQHLHNKIDKAYKYIKNKQVIDLDYLERILKDSDVDE